MSTTNFSDGTSLVSSANTPDTLADIFQPIITKILGTGSDVDPDGSVRAGWPPAGQPGWKITDDRCFLTATADDAPYSRVRDTLYEPNDAASNTELMAFTQVWSVHFVLYGPNGFDRARLILSAMDLDWVHDAFAAQNLYGVVSYPRPTYRPELFQGQWWKRTDMTLKFNELVNESRIASTAAGVDVTIITDAGETEEFVIGDAQ